MSQFQTTQEDWSVDYSSKLMDVRRQKYLRRAGAARKLQSMYRRYKGRADKDKRDLGKVVRSYRKANPYQIQPSSGRTVSFWRKTQVSIFVNQGFGWAASGTSLNWGFSLGRIIGFLNGTFTYSLTVPNSSEFQALFDYYCIKNVKMQVFFTHNIAGVTSASLALPMILVANDFDDIGETMTTTSINERVGCRTLQFENTGIKGINHYIKPKVSSVVVQTNVDTGVLSTANAGIVFGTQWIDVAQSNIVHNGIKLVYDNQGRTSSTDIGSMTFIFDVEYSFKGYR